jgi:O-methyltransferase involved in polyketide biosynthesis
MAARPGGTVVALGEGLETQFWRVDDGRVRWVTVELPEVLELQRELLPESPRRHAIARSALDFAWLDEVAGPDVLVTALGLLMYFERARADELIVRVAERLTGGAMVFDTVPAWASKATLSGKARTREGYAPPPMPYGSGRGERERVAALSPAIRSVHALRPDRGPDLGFGLLAPALYRLAPAAMPRIFALRF